MATFLLIEMGIFEPSICVIQHVVHVIKEVKSYLIADTVVVAVVREAEAAVQTEAVTIAEVVTIEVVVVT